MALPSSSLLSLYTSSLLSEFANFTSERDALENSLETLKTQKTGLSRHREEINARIENSRARITEMKAKREEMGRALLAAKERYRGLKNGFGELIKTVARVQHTDID